MMIHQETIDKIITSASIVDIINDFTALRKKGINFTACCPFHSEKTPSFVVSPVKGIYKCFGCGKGGNVVNFIMDHEHWTYPQALRFLAAKYNIPVPEEKLSPEEKEKQDKRESLKIINKWAAEYFSINHLNPKSVKYLSERSLEPQTLKEFKIGYASDSWQNLYNKAKDEGYTDELIYDASLTGKNKEGKYFDWFRNRLMFPFMDLSGNIIGFTGRLIIKSDSEAKYLNSHDTDIFKKGSALFGLYQAKKFIIEADKCNLVEGNIDVLTLHQKQIKNTICGSGTALTVDQIKLIRRFTNNITIIYDGDLAGIKASFKNIDLILQEGLNVRAIALPEGEDPDSFAKKKTPDQLAKWLHNNEKDFIKFKYDLLKKDIGDDTLKEATLIKEILHSISLIPDPVTRDRYKFQCIEKFKIDEKTVLDALKNAQKRKKEINCDNQTGWIGLDWALESIKEVDEVLLTSDSEIMNQQWEEENENIISWGGEINNTHLQELKLITGNIAMLDNVEDLYKNNSINSCIDLCIKAFKFGFNIKIKPAEGEYDNVTETVSFIDYYFKLAKKYLDQNGYDDVKKEALIEEASDLFSQCSQLAIDINTKKFAERLNLKEADFKKILKPFLEKQNSKKAIKKEVSDQGEMLQLDPDRLPDYVNRDEFHRWGYFPLQNKNGMKTRYVFKTQNGGLEVIGNFFMEPLFHVKDPDPNFNKRIVQINNADLNKSFFMEINSSTMADFSLFKKTLFMEGGNVFTKGKSNHHEMILASTTRDFPEVWELKIFGQQHEGFWAFTNAIFNDNKIIYMNDMGLVDFNDKKYYSPAYSKIYSGLRKDNDKYENDRYFIYQDNLKTSFDEWAGLMDQVYKLNDNGKWAILFSILSAFKSNIFPIDRLFTSLFFIGPIDSGKSQIAISCRSIFMKPETPLFNLNSGTDAAFFTTLERLRDVIIIFEEYNDNDITDIKFQGLKAAVYDVEGKQKRKDASSKDIDISKINGVPLILGQVCPERDGNSLHSRCIMCHVPKKDLWTDSESIWFKDLKEREKEGLSNILTEILKQREIIKDNFQQYQKSVYKTIRDDLSKKSDTFQTRILNTVSLFLAICKLWEEKVPELKLPFTYKKFYEIARAKIIHQSEAISSTNPVSIFFDTVELLLNKQNGLIQGKEFKIESHKFITIQKNRNETEELHFENEIKIIYLRLTIIHPMYHEVRRDEALKYNNLISYLKDHPSFIGQVKCTRFQWNELQRMPDPLDNDKIKEFSRIASANTSATAFRYDIVKDAFNLDMEKFETPQGIEYSKDANDNPKLNFQAPDDTKEPKEDLPF